MDVKRSNSNSEWTDVWISASFSHVGFTGLVGRRSSVTDYPLTCIFLIFQVSVDGYLKTCFHKYFLPIFTPTPAEPSQWFLFIINNCSDAKENQRNRQPRFSRTSVEHSLTNNQCSSWWTTRLCWQTSGSLISQQKCHWNFSYQRRRHSSLTSLNFPATHPWSTATVEAKPFSLFTSVEHKVSRASCSRLCLAALTGKGWCCSLRCVFVVIGSLARSSRYKLIGVFAFWGLLLPLRPSSSSVPPLSINEHFFGMAGHQVRH